MVRPGVALYGYELPFSGNGSIKPLGLKHVLSWKTRIIATREIPAGTPVGYNGAWTAKRRTRLGVIPVGYGDGFTRHLSSAGRVIVREQYAPIVGNVSMDLSTIDLTDVTGADIGDEAVPSSPPNTRASPTPSSTKSSADSHLACRASTPNSAKVLASKLVLGKRRLFAVECRTPLKVNDGSRCWYSPRSL
jgi:alanine racemase